MIENVKKQYSQLSKLYAGQCTEQINHAKKIMEEKLRIEKEHEYQLKLRDMQVEMITQKYEYELKLRDKDIEHMKSLLASK
jgi:hypothetical protein